MLCPVLFCSQSFGSLCPPGDVCCSDGKWVLLSQAVCDGTSGFSHLWRWRPNMGMPLNISIFARTPGSFPLTGQVWYQEEKKFWWTEAWEWRIKFLFLFWVPFLWIPDASQEFLRWLSLLRPLTEDLCFWYWSFLWFLVFSHGEDWFFSFGLYSHFQISFILGC